MKKWILLVVAVLLLTGCNLFIEKWTYEELPNGYLIKKTSETNMVLGKYIDGLFEIETDDKKIGVEEYIAEFQTGKRYIALKCAKTIDKEVAVLFYIIDTLNEDVYGPYNSEETYNEVKQKIVDEELSDWIKTIDIHKK